LESIKQNLYKSHRENLGMLRLLSWRC